VISHGGYNTVLESLSFATPVLLIPMITADRMEVARRVIENGVGRCVNYYNLEPGRFHQALDDVLTNPLIAAKTLSLSELLEDWTANKSFIDEVFSIMNEVKENVL
jgi:UDP:flavonoid glycosyltransferase YjiC (YdhE family)